MGWEGMGLDEIGQERWVIMVWNDAKLNGNGMGREICYRKEGNRKSCDAVWCPTMCVTGL